MNFAILVKIFSDLYSVNLESRFVKCNCCGEISRDGEKCLETYNNTDSNSQHTRVDSVVHHHSGAAADLLFYIPRLLEHKAQHLLILAEWEYAARAGTKSPIYGDLDVIGWY